MDYAFALSRSFSMKGKVDFADIFDVIKKGNLWNAIEIICAFAGLLAADLICGLTQAKPHLP